MWSRFTEYYDYLCFGIISVIAGIYIFRNDNYLADPRVTPPPPPTGIENAGSIFITSSWFAVALLIGGVILLCGALGDRRMIRNIGLAWIAPLYGALACVFTLRGLFDYHFNLTWIFSILALAWIFKVASQGGRHD